MLGIEGIGFGTYRLGNQTYGSVKYALEQGYEWIDTAPLYQNQVDVGKAIKNCGRSRSNFKITSKISRDALIDGQIVKCFFDTLKIMGVDHIDELILHEPIDPIKNWKRLVDLYQNEGRGLIYSIGVSNFNLETIDGIIDATNVKPSVNQIEINPFLTRGDLPFQLIERGINIVAHTPLAKGEKLDDSKLGDIAKAHNVSPAQLMLKWGLQMGYRVIPRSSKCHHIDENIGADFTLDADTMGVVSTLDCGHATHPKYLEKSEYKKVCKK
jgi:2,5-diketo-D-gluconate reductase A